MLKKAGEKGISASSFGKFDDIRRWIAEKLGLDWQRDTYATGAGTTAHNFGSRWSQSNQVSGRRLRLGLGFIKSEETDSTKKEAAVKQLIRSAKDTSLKFVDGSRATSYEAIVIFVQLNDDGDLAPAGILAMEGSGILKALQEFFPDAELTPVALTAPLSKTEEAGATAAPSIRLPLPEERKAIEPSIVDEALKAFSQAGFRTDAEIVRRAFASLLTKPFLILAGVSGSGKTQLARLIAHWLGSPYQRAVIAVGADWTSTQQLLGYPDALDNLRYETTETLDLLIRADANPSLPFFLILDEMNLSHVERYFSDFLSSLESKEKIRLHNDDALRSGIPARISLPPNVFVIGTVNIDETTFMFSPKVLDRANVIEFHQTRSAMADYLDSPRSIDFSSVEGLGLRYARDFVEAVSGTPPVLEQGDTDYLKKQLLLCFDAVNLGGFSFSFRTAGEITRFISFHRLLSGAQWDRRTAFDAQLVQRIMPKLQGDRRRLDPVLTSLAEIASNTREENQSQSPTQDGSLSQIPELPASANKILRMSAKLEIDGFTTYIEA